MAHNCPAVKFVKIVATQAIPNWPDQQCPAILVYRKTDIHVTLVGMGTMGGMATTPEILEWILSEHSVVETEQESDPRLKVILESHLVYRTGICLILSPWNMQVSKMTIHRGGARGRGRFHEDDEDD